MSLRSEVGLNPGSRILSVKPRKRGYVHKNLIAYSDGYGLTEFGEIIEADKIPAFTLADPYIWITHNPIELLVYLRSIFNDLLEYTFTDSREPDGEGPVLFNTKLSGFGFAPDSLLSITYGKKGKHTIWHPTRMFSTPKIALELVPPTHSDLLIFGKDIREWCCEQNLPLKSSLPGIAASLSRDKRFWPNDRGRVPRSTNERIRKYLPGVYQELRETSKRKIPTAIALDQERAYHNAAQTIPLPNGTNLYARGFFGDPDNAPELWAQIGSEFYNRIIRQHGLFAVVAGSRPARKGEWRPPVCDDLERKVRYVWSNELDFCAYHGLKIEGLVAAWTSEDADTGIAAYGKWASAEVLRATAYRKNWLKPTLHAMYGLLGARPRNLHFGRSHGQGNPDVYVLQGYAFDVNEYVLKNSSPATTNVATLGGLQSCIRERTLSLANEYGQDVLHVHADGLHLRARQLAFLPVGWIAEEVTNLQYIDNVSWVSDQKDVLPGRDMKMRIELRRQLVQRINGRS